MNKKVAYYNILHDMFIQVEMKYDDFSSAVYNWSFDQECVNNTVLCEIFHADMVPHPRKCLF